MLKVYLSSPGSQLHCDKARGMPVLLSFAVRKGFWKEWAQSFDGVLIDSGAFSVMTQGTRIDVSAYRDWCAQWPFADALAGLDDVEGDWRKSLKHYAEFPDSFPTYHPGADPPELLDELITMARERGGWLGLGLVPPREGKRRLVREALEQIPADLHVHGWALYRYTHIPGMSSTDSTYWFREAMALRARAGLMHLTYGECLEIMVKRIQRQGRLPDEPDPQFDWLSP